MKPKNKFQKQVFELSQKLPRITNAQKEWAYQNCIEHIGRKTRTGTITCMECGHAWQGNSHLADTLLGVKCPECSAKLKVANTQKRVFKQSEYFCTVTVCGDFQVVRFFYIQSHAKSGQKNQYAHTEIVQWWIAPNGKYTVMSKLRHSSFYCDLWNLSSNIEIRSEKLLYNIMPTAIYPHQRVIPELKRRGYKQQLEKMTPVSLFRALLSDSKMETLLKAEQTKLLQYFAYNSHVNEYWSSMKICIRNGYKVHDASIWRDYIDLLRFFGKDIHNAKYVCPADLKTEHDRYVQKKREYQERQCREQAKQKAKEYEAIFREAKSRFFGIQFTDGQIQVRVLESVDEIMQEGDAMRHCVFENEYHLKSDSLILSACMDGKRLETVELSLSQLRVIQSRGVCNKNTKYHEQIIKLVNNNIPLIEKRLAA